MIKTTIRSLLLLPVFVFLSGIVKGQYYNTGQDPANLKWLQIKTGKFTVVYPEKYGSQGIEFARPLEKANSDLSLLFPQMKFRIPVVIHNFTTESNGYVAWAPKRMEIYPTPEQNSIPLDPVRQLALHELTHVMQMESLNTGTTKFLSFLLGQQVTGAITLTLPMWFMEGDAVFSETVLSGSGRGRSPDFLSNLKALTIEKDHIYKYDKLLNGSFKDYTPDHYQFGYQMVAWSFAKNNPDLWNKIMHFAGNQPFTLNPVNIDLKKATGLTKESLYIQTFDSLKVLWKKDIESGGAVPYKAFNPDKKGKYINYYSPLEIGTDSIAAVKTLLSDPASMVLIRPSLKSEKKIHTPGLLYPYFFSYGHGKLVWVETTYDPRWKNREYSVIKLKNLKTGQTLQLTHRSRYLSASISPDGKIIAASENTADNKNSLVFLNSSDGCILQTIKVPGNASLQRPQWSDDGGKITVIYLTTAGEGIMSYSLMDNSWKVLVEASGNDLQSSYLRNDSLFFTSSVSGTENGYLITPGNKLFSVTNSRFGVNDLSVNGHSIMFCDYTSSGNDICSLSLNMTVKEVNNIPKPGSILADRFKFSLPEAGKNEEFTPKPYRKWQHLFNIHSWMPFYTDINRIGAEPLAVNPGVLIMSQNLLSTLTATVGYEYTAKKRNMIHTHFTWNGWYPVWESQLDYGNYPLIYKKFTDPAPVSIMPGYRFVNTLSLPLSIASGKFTQFIYFAGISDYENNYIFNSGSGYDHGQEQLTGRFYFYNFYKSALRDIYPGWAQVIDLAYSFWPYDKTFFGPEIYLKTSFYFPGFLPNNSIRLRYETEQQTFARYLTGNRVDFPRSYTNIMSGKLDFLSADYYAPLLYPDFNISSVLYLTRIRTGVFYDWGRGYDNYYLNVQNGSLVVNTHSVGPDYFKSFGGQLLADFYLFRIPYMISAGAQAAWKALGQAPAFELLFNININGMIIGRNPRL